METLSDRRFTAILTRAKCLVIALTYRSVGPRAGAWAACQAGEGPRVRCGAVSDRPSVSRVIHAPLKSYEIYAGRDHVRTRGLRLLILKCMYLCNATPTATSEK